MSYLSDIYDYIKKGETQSENLGLEIEHFVVNESGVQITFDEISPLIEKVGKEIGADIIYVDGFPAGYSADRYTITLEPACQFEISINPYSDLSDIEKIYTDFLSLWEPLFEERGYRLITKGNLPLVECQMITPDQIPLTPKKRYQCMDNYFRTSGKYGKYMMRASASTQVSIDYHSEDDLIRKLRVLQKISPVLMIMMESKTRENTTLPGVNDRPHLLRIQEWDDLDPDRTGFYPGSLDPDFGYDKIADVVYHTPLILLTDNGVTTDVGHRCAEDLVLEQILPETITDDARKTRLVEHFLSMGFFHFRIKKYIEIRVADSVPIKKALGYAALLKGIVYSDRNLDILENMLSSVDSLDKIQEAILKIQAEGLDAVIYDNKTAAEWISTLIGLAEENLPGHEKEYLRYVRTFRPDIKKGNTDERSLRGVFQPQYGAPQRLGTRFAGRYSGLY